MLERVGIRCEKNPDLSERFCKACAEKLRRTYEGFNFIASNIISPNPEFGLEEEEEDEAQCSAVPDKENYSYFVLHHRAKSESK